MLKRKVALGVLTLTCSSSYAQMTLASIEEDFALLYGGEDIISIATGTEKPIHLAPSVASVITAADIKAMGARTVVEALEFVPGLHVSKNYNRMSDLFSIRGIHSQFNAQVLFLINGVVIEDLQTNSVPLMYKLPVANISRIEIIRGPGSAVYGADAFAGVINIITKSIEEIGSGNVGARVGSFNTRDLWVQTALQISDWDTALSFEYHTAGTDKNRIIESDAQALIFDPQLGTNATRTPGPINTDVEIFNTSITLTKDAWNIWFNSWNQRDAGVAAGVAPALDREGIQDSDIYSFSVNFSEKDFRKHLDLDVRAIYTQYAVDVYFQLFPANTTFPVGSDGNLFTPSDSGCPTLAPGGAPTCLVKFKDGVIGNPSGIMQTYSAETALTYDQFETHQIRLAIGAEFFRTKQNEKKNFGPNTPLDGAGPALHLSIVDSSLTNVGGSNGIYLPNKTRQLSYITLQDEWRFAPDWEFTGGVRYDHYSDFGNTLNPRLAFVWATDYNLTSKLLYGRAFRAPSFGELYYQNNPSTNGNPDLDPETIDMAELVFDYRPNFELQTVLNLYSYEVDGLIDFRGGKAQNVLDLTGHGVEFDINWQLNDKLIMLINMAWQHSVNRETKKTIANTPGQQISFTLRHKTTQNCHLSGQANWVAKRKRAKQALSAVSGVSDDPRNSINDYTTVDLNVRCQIPQTPIEFAISLRNAFDADAREPSPYNPDLLTANMPNDYPLEGRNGYVEMIYRFE